MKVKFHQLNRDPINKWMLAAPRKGDEVIFPTGNGTEIEVSTVNSVAWNFSPEESADVVVWLK